jgi:hypothetical protein
MRGLWITEEKTALRPCLNPAPIRKRGGATVGDERLRGGGGKYRLNRLNGLDGLSWELPSEPSEWSEPSEIMSALAGDFGNRTVWAMREPRLEEWFENRWGC